MAIKTNPENGRRSGDYWSLPTKAGEVFSKGDMVAVNSDGEIIRISMGTAVDKFIGVIDEDKQDDNNKNVIIITKGVFPFNKNELEHIKAGQALNVLATDTVSASIGSEVIGICYREAKEGSETVLVYIKPNKLL